MIGKNKLKRNTAKRYSFLLAERIKKKEQWNLEKQDNGTTRQKQGNE